MLIFKGGNYPAVRLRRLRQYEWIRRLTQETHLHVEDLILPIFIRDPKIEADISALKGVKRYTLDELPPLIERVMKVGLPAAALFPCLSPVQKTECGDEALNPHNLICQSIKRIKEIAGSSLGVIVDIALDPFTTHGHDGIFVDGMIDNDQTLSILGQQALVYAEAGADVVAPSDMMDGRVGFIRRLLDAHHFQNVMILSYAVKYASSFYGPFRQAVQAPALQGLCDKKTYQMNPANIEEALREVALDVEEGADMIMVKPGLPYLDVISRVRGAFSMPTFAYQVSGEYAMIKAMGEQGLGDETALMMESLLAFKRAGATGIFTYAALEIAEGL